MSLRLQINLIVGTLIGVLVAAMIALQVQNVRKSVHEEIIAANRVTAQLLKRVAQEEVLGDPTRLVQFLEQLGRVRANDITYVDGEGRELYRSPPSTWKAGRDAPQWFSALVVPERSRQVLNLPLGSLIIDADASRAVLDGWEDLVRLAAAGAAVLLLINLLVFWAVGRVLHPLSAILKALRRLEDGDFDVRLPALPGKEAAAIGAVFNRMAAVLKAHVATRQRAFEAERRLSDSRDLAALVEQHIEAERREIAKALHDELGQSVTAIRSLAMMVSKRCDAMDPEAAHAARVIGDEAGRLYDHMHGMIPRLAPMALDTLGLAGALDELLERTRANYPEVAVDVDTRGLPPELPASMALTAYRIAQEGLTNALRHSGAHHVRLVAGREEEFLVIRVQDDGRGAPSDWRRPGHFGLRWLVERAHAAGGELVLISRPGGGSELCGKLPLEPTWSG